MLSPRTHNACNGHPPEIVLDFFAGTGSTMDAVFRQNAEDQGNRRCILVQLPEPLDGTGGSLKTIADITKERLRRSAAKDQGRQSAILGRHGLQSFQARHVQHPCMES
jgi:adenine-specific DNA-methyltransferase